MYLKILKDCLVHTTQVFAMLAGLPLATGPGSLLQAFDAQNALCGGDLSAPQTSPLSVKGGLGRPRDRRQVTHDWQHC